jgi:DNA-binding Lrp family transcriptional regulator
LTFSDSSHDSHTCIDLILKLIDDSEVELTPVEIAQELNLKRSTVRNYLRKLVRESKIVQPYPGAYCNKITYGVRFVPLLVHNVRLRCFVGVDVASWEWVEVVGGVKVYVCFGAERRKVSGFIACDVGMSREACLLALHRWFDVAEEHLGGSLPEIELQSFEVNKDYVGVRLDGVSCFTKEGLFGVVERVYQKSENVVRAERKVSQPMSVTQFESLLQGGVSGYTVTQMNFALMQRVDQLLEAHKFTNSQLLQYSKLLEAMYKRMISGGKDS